MNNEYTPDAWVIIRIEYESEKLYKVLAGWSGGYLHGGSWRMSSGISKVVEKSNHYEFHNVSGSVYLCNHKGYRLTMDTAGVYNNLCTRYSSLIQMMPDNTMWCDLSFMRE